MTILHFIFQYMIPARNQPVCMSLYDCFCYLIYMYVYFVVSIKMSRRNVTQMLSKFCFVARLHHSLRNKDDALIEQYDSEIKNRVS